MLNNKISRCGEKTWERVRVLLLVSSELGLGPGPGPLRSVESPPDVF